MLGVISPWLWYEDLFCRPQVSPELPGAQKAFSPLGSARGCPHTAAPRARAGGAGPAPRPRQRFPAGPFPRSTARLRGSAGAGARSVSGRGPWGKRGLYGGTGLPRRRGDPAASGRGAGARRPGPREASGRPGWLHRRWRGRWCFCLALTPRVSLWEQPVTAHLGPARH